MQESWTSGWKGKQRDARPSPSRSGGVVHGGWTCVLEKAGSGCDFLFGSDHLTLPAVDLQKGNSLFVLEGISPSIHKRNSGFHVMQLRLHLCVITRLNPSIALIHNQDSSRLLSTMTIESCHHSNPASPQTQTSDLDHDLSTIQDPGSPMAFS